MLEKEPPYSQKVYGILKELYGDEFTHTPESFEQKINSDSAYTEKVFGIMQEAYGEEFTHTFESFSDKLKKKEVSGQGSDPLTQNLPVKTVPQKIASKGQQPSAKPKPAPTVAAGDPFANQQAAAAVNYDPTSVRDAIKGVREGLDKTYRVAQEGKRKIWPATWNTQQAYSYIKPSVDYTQQMLDKIKNIQDPEIQSLYNELNNANQTMKDMVGKAWNDRWDESSVNQYIGGLSRDMAAKIDQVDRRMAELQRQKPTAQQQQGQQVFRQAEIKAPKKQPLPEKSEQQVKEEEEMAKMPSSGLRIPTEEELDAEEERMTYAERRFRFENSPTLKRMYVDYDDYEAMSKIGRKWVGEEISADQWKEFSELFSEANAKRKIKADADFLEKNMGKRYEQINLETYQKNVTTLYDAWINARTEDPNSDETKSLAKDLRFAESQMEEAYRNLDLDYLESTSANQPTLTKEKIDRYNKIIKKIADEKIGWYGDGEKLTDADYQFLADTRRGAINAYATINNAKLIRLKEKSNLPGYSKDMAELSPLMQEIIGDQSMIKYASEQIKKKAEAEMAPIQEEYGKKRDEVSAYETQLNNIDTQIKQLEAAYQVAGSLMDQQQLEAAINQLQFERQSIYGSYETSYNALTELNKAMETAITPFNTELSNLQDPYNKKIQQLNEQISEIKRKNSVDDSVLAEADILYKNLASAQEAIKITNAQFNEVFYTEEYNKMLQEERKKGITSSKAVNAGSEFLLQFTNGMSQLAFGAMKLPKALGLEDSDEWGWVDDAYAAAVQIQNESSGTFGALQGNDVPKYLQLAGQIGQGVSSSLVYGLSGGISAPVLLTTTATTFVLSAGDNYQRAIDAGMDTGQAQIFANLISLVQSGAELIFNDAELFTSTAGNTILTNVIKNGLTVKQAFKIAMKDLPRKLREKGFEVLQENLEEITSLVAENMALNATNVIAGKKYFDDNLTKGDFEDTFITTAGSTLITQFLFSGSGLDPNTRMALFKSVQNSQKILDHAEKIGVEAKKLAQLKKDVEDAKLKLSVCESHTNWGRMNDSQKAYAFDVARQLSELEKARKNNEQNGVVDESLTQRAKEAKEELNEALNNPEAVEQREKTESNTREVLEAIKNGEDYPQQMTQHPNWNRLSDEQKKEVESLAEDLEEKQSEINGLSEVGLEDQSIVSKRNEIQDKISEILNNPKNDQENIQGVSGEVGVGQEPVAAQPLEGTSGETTEAGGVLQAPGQEEVVTTTEAAPETTVETKTPATETVTRISEVAPAVRRAGAVEASEGNNQNAGAESALEGVGMDNASLDEWKKKNKAPSKKGRIEELTQAVRDLISGKIKFKEYYEKAKKLMPSKLMDKVPTPATNEEIVGSIDKNKLGIGIINLNKFVKKGMKVGLRIDIPAFNNFGKNVVTVHDRSGSGQPVVGYGSTGSIQNVNFRTSVSTASKIGAGESKSAFAMAEGQWMDESPESIQKRAEEALNSPEWVQVGMNPTRNSFFFDKSDGNPILSADEVLQVGNLVLAKNPKKIDLNTEEGMAQFEKQFSARSGGVTYQFRESEETTGEEAIQEDESVERAEETNPEIIKIEEERAAELEAFENDENLTEIDGEQVLLTPDGRITRDTINEKYDKEVEYQREIESVVAEIKKQQDPEYQEALRKAIDADPKAGTNVHQMAAENILSGMSPNEAIATATEQAAQKARTDKARQAMEREGLVSNKEDVRKAIANVMRALRSTGIRVRDPLPPGKFEEERKKAKASDTAEAWFRSKTGEIVFSQKALEDGWGTTIVFHEGTHPILNIIRNTNRPLYNKAIKGLRAAAKAEKLNGKPNPLKDVEAWVNKAAGKKSQEQQDDEFMTETIARLASGDIEIKRMPATLKEKFVEVLNRIAKFMGFKRIFLNSPDYEFRRLANQIATTLAKGEKIEKIVGKRNVKKYQAKFVQPRAIELLMGKENLSKYGLEPGKKYNVRQIYEAFEKRQKDLFGQIDRKDYSEKTMKQLAEWAKDEVMFMMTQFPDESGTGWYTTKFQAALDEVAKIFPELKTDKGQRSLFTMLVAIYSDGTKVEKNMSNAIMAYSDYKRTGVIPNTETGGERNASFNANINEINRLMADFDGDFDAITEYLLEEKTGAELSQDSEENRELSPLEQKIGLKQTTEKNGKKNFDNAVKAAGISLDSKEYKEHEKFIKEQKFTTQWPAEMILPVASRVFGPKLGMFYSNLMGKEGYPTLDRWFSRLFNRYRGDLMPRLTGLKGKEKDTKGELQGVARFKSFIGKPGISDAKAIEEAKDRALKFGSRTKLGDSSKASKMLSPVEKKVGMKQGLDKASKEKFKKAAKAAGIQLTSPEFKAHEQFVKDRTGGFWTELEGKVGFKQGSKDTDKKRFDEAAAKLGYGPDSKLYKNHLADKAANTIYKAAFVALNDAPFNSKDRKFMFDTLVEARKMLKKEGVDVTVADIQAILWYYEKKLYVSQGGLESAMGISYQEAAENSVEEYKRNGGVLDTEITEEDLIDEEGETDLEGMDIQPSTPREGGRIGKYDILPGAPTPKNAAGPIPELVDVAESYAKKFGVPYTRQGEYVQVDEEFATRIANAYEEMKHDPKNPKVKEAYDDLIRQTTDQYNALMNAGYEFTFFDGKTDPYQGNPVDAMRDLRENKRMAVYGTYDGYGTEGITGANIEDNPMLAPTGLQWPDQSGKMHDVTANDLFRAVHDAFGHGLEGAGFRARGEENAWQAHARLFTGPAVAAITSETRGQNSWLNFNPKLLKDVVGEEKARSLHPDNWQNITVGEHNRTAKLDDTIFAEQKTGLLPEWTSTEKKSPAMEQVEVTSGSERISKTLGIDDTIQPSEIVGRGEKLVRSGEITESDRQIALYAIQNKMGIKTTNADMIRVSKMSPEQKIKLIEDAFQDRVKKMNPAFRDPETRDQNRFYQNAVDAKNRALALVPKETIQPTEPGRYDKKDIPDLIERAVAGIDADLRKGIPLLEAIENNMTNQDWYPLLTDRQKRQVQAVLETTFEEEIASLPTEKEEAAEIGVDENIRELTSELEDLYYQIRDGRRNERNRAQARRDEILRGNPKLSYIYKNIDLINAQLEERGLLTKSIGCP